MSALLDSFEQAFSALPPVLVEAHGHGPSRRALLAAAIADGLPGHRSEAWKYTSLRALSARALAPASTAPAIDANLLSHIPSPRIVFVNGGFDAQLSRLRDLPMGVDARPLSQALAGDDARTSFMLGRAFERAEEVFARLNAALATEGALVRVAASADIVEPLHLVFVGAPADTDLGLHLRHLVELREDAALTVVEHHLGAGLHRHLFNHVMHVHLKPGARLRHVRMQDEAASASLFARTDAVLASRAAYRRIDLELGAGLSRHELNVSLQGVGASVRSGGVLLANGRRHIDTRLGIEHVARDTSCNLLWRGLADERGRAVFHGGILIKAGADGSEASLSNKNLLLSDTAEIDTQPVLEIHADEVQAAHGATIGRLDETALFYLRARGIPLAMARRMLIDGFLREPLAQLDDSALSAVFAELLLARLNTGETP